MQLKFCFDIRLTAALPRPYRGIVIPKSINADRIRTNAQIFDFSLTSEEMENLEKLNCDFRVVSVGGNRNHKYYPFRENYAE